ncbi:hypothetical protein CCMSSC00406_0005452 [Pleurotus cornucopiae]|uniref:Uncharacterized protein n=1 Tax=Pleurotus cornucopiae TaxID=5321 RepID=A0ACB7IUA2_PLECO|nr:hypothetical protein CCMSSC00406_0005452 [Pleurotus cornucopiae]
MAGLEALSSIIYHEKQQSGSMLCAQHALNSLLQGNYFSAPDLSDIARNLDNLEESYRHQDDDSTRETSTNMDDTGFFSVQVLENALSVWGLNLVRWRSAEMRAYQDRPHTQLGFILNLQQHWFTLRRFGPAEAKIDLDTGEGHWFNLNSFLPAPEWVGKLYLGMLLQQAEADGYSVFVVTQADPSAPLALARTDADQIAATLPEPSEAPNYQASRSYTTHPTTTASTSRNTGNLEDDGMEGFEDEDLELQAALQASMMSPSGRDTPMEPPHLARATVPLPSSGPPSAPGSGAMTPQTGGRFPEPPIFGAPVHPPHPTGDADLDPVAASMERNRVRLQRMREQQEFAQREMWAERGFGPEGPPPRDDDNDEDEMLRKAIEESEALAREQGHGSSDNREEEATASDNPYPSTSGFDARVYDDEDAELQAALKASLEHVPADWTPPEVTYTPPRHTTTHAPRIQTDDTYLDATPDADDSESVVSEASTSIAAPPTPVLDPEEIRRKRLARFGA